MKNYVFSHYDNSAIFFENPSRKPTQRHWLDSVLQECLNIEKNFSKFFLNNDIFIKFGELDEFDKTSGT